MDAVTLAAARAQGDKRYANLYALRKRDLPGVVPTYPTTATATLSAASSSAIAGSHLVACWEPGAFTYYCTQPTYAAASGSPASVSYTGNGGGTNPGAMPSGTATSLPWAAEFDVETADGRFEIVLVGKGLGTAARVLVNGNYVEPETTTTLAAAVTSGASSISTNASIRFGSKATVYSGATVSGFATGTPTGTGPYTIPILNPSGAGGGTISNSFASGAAVTIASSTFQFGADNSTYYCLVAMTAGGGRYRVRVEMESGTYFRGVQVAPAGSVCRVPKKAHRVFAIGDSFTEPTIVSQEASIAWDGWAQKLSYLLGCDVWNCASGGTGYLKTNGARVKFRDHLSDVTANMRDGDAVIWAGGLNDYSAFTASAIGTEALACFQAIRAQFPNSPQYVIAPFWDRGFSTYDVNLLATRDAIKASAAQVSNCWFLDTLSLPLPSTGANSSPSKPAATTLSAAAASGAASVSLPVSLPLGTYMQIGSDTNAEVRRVGGVTGTGPYTHTFGGGTPESASSPGGGGNLSRSHNAGDPVTPVGTSMFTGTGSVVAPTSDGNADLARGTDSTHPTRFGHRVIARTVFALIAQTLAD